MAVSLDQLKSALEAARGTSLVDRIKEKLGEDVGTDKSFAKFVWPSKGQTITGRILMDPGDPAMPIFIFRRHKIANRGSYYCKQDCPICRVLSQYENQIKESLLWQLKPRVTMMTWFQLAEDFEDCKRGELVLLCGGKSLISAFDGLFEGVIAPNIEIREKFFDSLLPSNPSFVHVSVVAKDKNFNVSILPVGFGTEGLEGFTEETLPEFYGPLKEAWSSLNRNISEEELHDIFRYIAEHGTLDVPVDERPEPAEVTASGSPPFPPTEQTQSSESSENSQNEGSEDLPDCFGNWTPKPACVVCPVAIECRQKAKE